MLKRKLRLELLTGEQAVCFCRKKLDNSGNPVLSCKSHFEMALSNNTGDGICILLHKVCRTVKLISGNIMIDTESPHIIDLLTNPRPLDISTLLNHMLDQTAWRCPLKRLGFDIVCIPSRPDTKFFTKTVAACKNEVKLHFSDGKKGKILSNRKDLQGNYGHPHRQSKYGRNNPRKYGSCINSGQLPRPNIQLV